MSRATTPATTPGSRTLWRLVPAWLQELALVAAISVGSFLVIQAFVVQPFGVQQRSMEGTLRQGDYVLVDKLTPRFTGFARGDIVVFRPPDAHVGDGVPYIKRVIGLPGDTVELRDGAVFVNGTRLEEPYVYGKELTLATDGIARFQVYPQTLFVLGDHRSGSVDSRARRIGAVPFERVIGRAWVRYWPLDAVTPIAAPSYQSPATAGR